MMKKFFACVLLFVAMVVIVFGATATQSYRFWIQDASNDSSLTLFEIEEGTSFGVVADSLEEQELIASSFWFKVYAKLDGTAGLVRAGSYELQPGINYAELIDMMIEHKGGEEISITIPEGYNLDQMGSVVIANFEISQPDWDYWTGVNSPLESHSFVVSAKKPDSVDLEGYLFPDTYRFFVDADVETIVTALVDEMQERVESIDGIENVAQIAGIDTIHDMLTLASVIEKEVPSKSEMKIVADVFLKRLEIDMALQSCATVNYITGKDTPAVSNEDLEIDSPYNTYMYSGLTPGPITNPGFSAIESVIIPTPNNYFYFLATPQGETLYAETYDEHLANKARYLD